MSFDLLREQICACRECAEEFGFEPHPIVFGNQTSKIMQISQAPSQTVHATLKPFNDASGRRLRSEWYLISDDVFYDPDNFYITSMAHCYPGKSVNGGDRPPPIRCAKKWLVNEMQMVDCKMILLLGGRSASFFFPKCDFSTLVFSDHTLLGKPAYVLPHPSPLNAKWLKDNPAFLRARLPVIRRAIHDALGCRAV